MTTSRPPAKSAPPPPSDAYPPSALPTRAPRPKSVDISFWLWITYLAIGAINAVIGFGQHSENRAEVVNELLAQHPPLDRAMVENLATALVVGMFVVRLLFVVADLAFALLMRGGRNWARVTLTILGSVSILFMIRPVGTDLQLLFQLLLLASAIAMMFQPPVNDWFRSRRRQS